MFAHCTNSNSTRREPEPEEDENHDSGFYKRGIIGFRITTDRQGMGRAGQETTYQLKKEHTLDPAVHSNSIIVPFRFVRCLDLSRENESLIHGWLGSGSAALPASVLVDGGGLSGKESAAEHLPLIYGFPARGKLSAGE